MKLFKLIFIYTFAISSVLSQDLLEDLSGQGSIGDSSQIFTERVITIGRSQKIFILTNTNSMLNKGDFITLIINDRDAAARAVVAKNHDSLVGIKILKIYSLSNWSKIYKGMDIKILKGDDSILFVKEKTKEEKEEVTSKIDGEEDLYAEELALESSFEGDFGKDKRLIKPDNIMNGAYGFVTITDDSSGDDGIGGHELSGGWAYQFKDNIWIEGLFSALTLNDYPADTKQTVVSKLTFRLKYTLKLPFYSFAMPYIGYQHKIVKSPDATIGQETTDTEALALGQIAAGVTLLRRLVPGWFLKIDLGTDLINVGAAIEF